MPNILFANNAFGALAANIGSGDTSLTLGSGEGARFPSPSGAQFFYSTLVDSSGNIEIVKCTSRSGDTLTITRGQEGTTARAYTAGDAVELRVTEDSLQELILNLANKTVTNTFTAGQRGEITTLTDGATITADMNDSNNFTVTLGGNRTLGNPTNQTAGQCGSIFIVQDGTGGRTLSYGSVWEFPGGEAPVLSTAANAVDRLDYVVRNGSLIHAVLTKAYS